MHWIDEYAQGHRENPTPAEARLRDALTEAGVHHAFQEPVLGKFIADFVILEGCGDLIVEVDGGYHDTKTQRKRDFKRTQDLRKSKYRVIRFRNEQVIDSTGDVLYRIRKEMMRPVVDPLTPKKRKERNRDNRVRQAIAQLKTVPVVDVVERAGIQPERINWPVVTPTKRDNPKDSKRERKRIRNKIFELTAQKLKNMRLEQMGSFEARIIGAINDYH